MRESLLADECLSMYMCRQEHRKQAHAHLHTIAGKEEKESITTAAVCLPAAAMGWLRSVGSIRLQVSLAEYRLFYRALLQKRPIISSILLTKATPYCRCRRHQLMPSTFSSSFFLGASTSSTASSFCKRMCVKRRK